MTIEEVIERLGYIKQQYNILLGTHIYDEVIDTAIKALRDNARLQGEWLKDYVNFKCSNCGKKAPYIYPNEHERFIEVKTNFCPNCGAYMKGGD